MGGWGDIITVSMNGTVIITLHRVNNEWLDGCNGGKYDCGSHYNFWHGEIMGGWVVIIKGSMSPTHIVRAGRPK